MCQKHNKVKSYLFYVHYIIIKLMFNSLKHTCTIDRGWGTIKIQLQEFLGIVGKPKFPKHT